MSDPGSYLGFNTSRIAWAFPSRIFVRLTSHYRLKRHDLMGNLRDGLLKTIASKVRLRIPFGSGLEFPESNCTEVRIDALECPK
jgi:hypothetical protein